MRGIIELFDGASWISDPIIKDAALKYEALCSYALICVRGFSCVHYFNVVDNISLGPQLL